MKTMLLPATVGGFSCGGEQLAARKTKAGFVVDVPDEYAGDAAAHGLTDVLAAQAEAKAKAAAKAAEAAAAAEGANDLDEAADGAVAPDAEANAKAEAEAALELATAPGTPAA